MNARTIVQIIGPVVDIAFERAAASCFRCADGGSRSDLEVQQQLGVVGALDRHGQFRWPEAGTWCGQHRLANFRTGRFGNARANHGCAG